MPGIRTLCTAALLLVLVSADSPGFTRHNQMIQMKDNVSLAASILIPNNCSSCGVILDYLPYRKGDSFYNWDYQKGSFFASRGFAYASVDIRGTGSSQGTLVWREYSEQELDDGEQVIAALAAAPWSNGRVGMIGISWGAFNGLMLAARAPPGLCAVVAIAGSEDLYYNDVHYMDGVKHFGEYILSMDEENSLPRPPEFKLDQSWRTERFEQPPWSHLYTKHQKDSRFWKAHSVKYEYDKVRVPLYMITGLYDEYRDFALNVYSGVRAAQSDPPLMKVAIGPYDHTLPDDSVIAPTYNSRLESLKWFKAWLGDQEEAQRYRENLLNSPDIALFVRESYEADPMLHAKHPTIPGGWVAEDWPIRRSTLLTLYPSRAHSLNPQFQAPSLHELKFKATAGVEMGVMWGELNPDMRGWDNASLVYDTAVLSTGIRMIGYGHVKLRVNASAPLAHWVVRLEDVAPNGSVTLVTGGLLNGAHRNGRDHPSYLTPGELVDITVPLHFSTWVFPKGHQLRLAVGNSLFRMVWPTPYSPMVTGMVVDSANTALILPIVDGSSGYPTPPFTQLPPDYTLSSIPSGFSYGSQAKAGEQASRSYVRRAPVGIPGEGLEVVDVVWHTAYSTNVHGWAVCSTLNVQYSANDLSSAHTGYQGVASYIYVENVTKDTKSDCVGVCVNNSEISLLRKLEIARHVFDHGELQLTMQNNNTLPSLDLSSRSWFQLDTILNITSNETTFHYKAQRTMTRNGRVIARVRFQDEIPRQFQ